MAPWGQERAVRDKPAPRRAMTLARHHRLRQQPPIRAWPLPEQQARLTALMPDCRSPLRKMIMIGFVNTVREDMGFTRLRAGMVVAACVVAGTMVGPSATAASQPPNCNPGFLCLYRDRSFGSGQLNIVSHNLANANTPGYSRSLGLFNNVTSSLSNQTNMRICLSSGQNRQGNVMAVGPHENWDQLPFWAEDDIESVYKC
ncbi:flagellar basal body protein [Streptomyces sp. NPDC090077]|uniref:flagellar basal body protein n=1 Tax=Streptomyces sp. NPDC090077 TaxID=3365938 RepID=UPI00381D1291